MTTYDIEGLATSLSISGSATQITAGEEVTLHGTLRSSTGGRIPSATVILERRAGANGDWEVVRVVPAEDGHVVARLAADAERRLPLEVRGPPPGRGHGLPDVPGDGRRHAGSDPDQTDPTPTPDPTPDPRRHRIRRRHQTQTETHGPTPTPPRPAGDPDTHPHSHCHCRLPPSDPADQEPTPTCVGARC